MKRRNINFCVSLNFCLSPLSGAQTTRLMAETVNNEAEGMLKEAVVV
jgi:hypothetical protein